MPTGRDVIPYSPDTSRQPDVLRPGEQREHADEFAGERMWLFERVLTRLREMMGSAKQIAGKGSVWFRANEQHFERVLTTAERVSAELPLKPEHQKKVDGGIAELRAALNYFRDLTATRDTTRDGLSTTFKRNV